MGISTSASVTDDAASQDLRQTVASSSVVGEASSPSRGPSRRSASRRPGPPHTLCYHTRARSSSKRRPCAHGCERKKHRKIKLKPPTAFTNVSLFPKNKVGDGASPEAAAAGDEAATAAHAGDAEAGAEAATAAHAEDGGDAGSERPNSASTVAAEAGDEAATAATSSRAASARDIGVGRNGVGWQRAVDRPAASSRSATSCRAAARS